MKPHSSVLLFLDSAHLSDPLFMKVFGQKLVSFYVHKKVIILHGDSSYSEQLERNGMQKSDAVIRATKEINQKLVSLLADNGISAIPMHGYHKNTVQLKDGKTQVSPVLLENIPQKVVLVLSNLCMDETGEFIIPIPVAPIAESLKLIDKELELLAFGISEKASLSFQKEKPGIAELLNLVPEEILRQPTQFKLTTLTDFDSNELGKRLVGLTEI